MVFEPLVIILYLKNSENFGSEFRLFRILKVHVYLEFRFEIFKFKVFVINKILQLNLHKNMGGYFNGIMFSVAYSTSETFSMSRGTGLLL